MTVSSPGVDSGPPIPMVAPSEIDNDNENKYVGTGRYIYSPTTAATLNLAATGAQCARVWQDIDAYFSENCLSAAQTTWLAATAHPAIYAGNNPGNGGGNDSDSEVSDEFLWAATELYITTGEEVYLDAMLDSPLFAMSDAFDWGFTAPLSTISLNVNAAKIPETQANQVRKSILAFADKMIGVQKKMAMPFCCQVPFHGDRTDKY